MKTIHYLPKDKAQLHCGKSGTTVKFTRNKAEVTCPDCLVSHLREKQIYKYPMRHDPKSFLEFEAYSSTEADELYAEHCARVDRTKSRADFNRELRSILGLK